jgi:hypothetical protein
MYKQSIIFFGIIVPMLAVAAIICGCFFLKNYIANSFNVKTSQYQAYTQSRNATMQIEGKVARQREHLKRWKSDLSVETTSSLRTNLKLISEKLPSKEFQETAFDPISGRGGFGSASTQKSSQIRLGFRGTFRTVQKALAELEARMPQLQLQELRIEPTQQGNLLNFQVHYTAWEN